MHSLAKDRGLTWWCAAHVRGPGGQLRGALRGGVQLTYVGQAASSADTCLLRYIMSFKRQHRLSQYFDVTTSSQTQAKVPKTWQQQAPPKET